MARKVREVFYTSKSMSVYKNIQCSVSQIVSGDPG